MQGGKNWILPEEKMQTGYSETLIGWKSGNTTYVSLWFRMDGAWRWTLLSCRIMNGHFVLFGLDWSELYLSRLSFLAVITK
jgi:hypothetical protein